MICVDAHCPICGHSFRENAERVREGQTLTCPNCDESWILSRSSPFDEILRVLQLAQEMRAGATRRVAPQPNRWYA